MSDDRPRPTSLKSALAAFVRSQGLEERLARQGVLAEWAPAVGARIAKVTEARAISHEGTLTVGVKSSAWMTELQMMERDLIVKANQRLADAIVKRIRWELIR
ncbi:MAG: DUF721 domain-containing protein [Gemmatimonadaceae bacterium]|nr:DUF721 domain-containing protein [Gemmatimonadaceae bacterium]